MQKNIFFNQFTFQYEGQKNHSLLDIALNIQAGEFLVLCGESGCGKSTLTRCVNGLIPEFYEGQYSGEGIIHGRNMEENAPEIAGQKISSIFQDSRSQFFTLNSTNEVAFACENYGIERKDMVHRVEKAFSEIKIEDLKGRSVFQLSSGERQKVAFAASVTLEPEVYVLDEPSANLDIPSIIQLKKILKKLKNQGATIIIAEHRLFYLIDLADRFIYMKDGKIAAQYRPDEMKHMKAEELSKKMLRAPSLEQIQYRMEDAKRNENQQLNFRAEGVWVEYNKNVPVLRGIDFESNAGETWCLIGHNGCGKTTLGMTVAGLLKYKQGAVYINNKKCAGRSLIKKVFLVMQEAEHQMYTDSVYKELVFGKSEEALHDKAEYILKKLGLYELKDKHPFALSGGQMQRVTIALAYISDKPIILLDEPTSGLDFKNMNLIADVVEEMRHQGRIVILISHDLEFIARTVTRCLQIEGGKVRENFQVRTHDDFNYIKDYMLSRNPEE